MSYNLPTYLGRIKRVEESLESFRSDFIFMLESEGSEGIEEKANSMASDYNGYDFSDEVYELLKEYCTEEEEDE